MTWPVHDVETDRVCVVLQDRPVVGLHRGLIDALAAADRDGRGVQVVTPSTSRLTVPLRMALTGGDRRWVVQGGEHRYFDGLSGEALHWSGEAFVGPADPDGTGDEPPYAAGAPRADEPREGDEQLWLSIQLHHTRPPVAFGLAVEAVCRAITGEPPVGWGTAEPVTQRWRPAELSALATGRGPLPTFLTVVGGGDTADGAGRAVIGTLEIVGGPAGSTESATLAIGHRAGQPPIPAELTDIVDALAREHPLTSFFAVHRFGRADLTCPAYGDGRGEPVGIALGPEALGQTDLADALALPGARQLGTPRRPTVWYDLAGEWDAFARISQRLGADIPA
jgi:hypothetical protein